MANLSASVAQTQSRNSHKRWGIRGRIDHPFDRGLDNLVCGIGVRH
jgi:hypothetical protein